MRGKRIEGEFNTQKMKIGKHLAGLICAVLAMGSSLSGQNVGIGTAIPLEKLHVAGNVRIDPLAGVGTRMVGADVNGTLNVIAAGTNGQVLTQTVGGPAWQSATVNWTVLGNTGTVAATNFIGTIDAVDFVVRTANTERIRVLSGGNVGIGTNAPAARLHVNGDVRVGITNPPNTGTLPSFGNTITFAGANAGATFNSENSDPIWMGRYNAASDASELRVNLGDNCNGVDAFVIQAGGSGCGANTEFFRFDATGAAYKPGGGSWATLSDRRVKRNVLPFADGMNVLNSIRPVTFEYNGLGGTADIGKVYVGVIAQELQQVAPTMVDETGEYLRVDPSAFTYLLINAVKEQQAQIEALMVENRLRGQNWRLCVRRW
jgi:hypothetical protein